MRDDNEEKMKLNGQTNEDLSSGGPTSPKDCHAGCRDPEPILPERWRPTSICRARSDQNGYRGPENPALPFADVNLAQTRSPRATSTRD